jgi:hypothetical protein
MDLTADAWRTQRVPISVSAFLAAEQARKPPPVAAKPEPPPPTSAPQPQASRDSRDHAPPLGEDARNRFAKQGRMLRVLAKIRGVAKIDGVDYQRFYRSAAELGSAAKLTESEYRQIRTELGRFPDAWPDGTQDLAKAIQREINLPLQAAAKHKRRAALAADKADRMATVAVVHCRASAIYTVLTYPRYQTMLEVMKALMKALAPSFRTADGKGLLTGGSLKKAIQREIKKPDLAYRVETKRERTRNGLPIDLFRRRR